MSVFSVLGCGHKKLSRVWTMPILDRLGHRTGRKSSYRVCLDCGRQIPYDLSQSIGREVSPEERFKFLERQDSTGKIKETWEPGIID